MKNKDERSVYTFDIETDPFDGKTSIEPFACCLFDGSEYHVTWGTECIREMKRILDKLPPGIVYVHNGGKFDMYFCMDWFVHNQEMMIVNSRIVKGKIWRTGSGECHEFRDSYAVMPFALKRYKKETVDYRTFTRAEREANRESIIEYLKSDCKNLHELCTAFVERFGKANLTIGSTAMKELRKLHKFDKLTKKQDFGIRMPYFYGGRVQCFEAGILEPTPGESIKIFDINQCYPNVMMNLTHPVSAPEAVRTRYITPETYFITVRGKSYGAFPIRTGTGLYFPNDDERFKLFCVSIHEYNAAIETGMFELDEVIECINFERSGTFAEFVTKYHGLRKTAQQTGDEIGALLYKYVGNSAYGKFAQNPENYFDFKLTDCYTEMRVDHNGNATGWEQDFICDMEGYGYIVWKRSSENQNRYNVATGASITGGARSMLIRALAKARRPLYCDTDSIICENLTGVEIDPHKIGAWKLERTGNRLAIAGRKMYALFGEVCPSCKGTQEVKLDECEHSFHDTGCVKFACKGAVLSPFEIETVASGEAINWHSNTPTIDFKRRTITYMDREIRRTV